MIRVVIADDQTLVRQGIRGLLALSTDVRVVAEAGDGDEAMDVIRREKPDVALLDVRMPKKTGVEVTRALREAGDKTPVVLLTTFDDDTALLDGVRAGVAGYLLKDVTLEQLLEAIRTTASGGTLIQPALTERAAAYVKSVGTDFDALGRPDPLTRRELEILRLLAGGFSNKEIADALGTAEGTVKNHASNIFSKLGVRDRTRAVLKAIELGYLAKR
jgi:DNA-binding NarL/FixJ family response regulator